MGMKVSGDARRLVTGFLADIDRIPRAVEGAMLDAAEDGARVMKENISTRGTLKSGKAGRIDKGYMLRAVTSDVTEATDEKITVEFGWLDQQEFYYWLQEVGFTHRSGAQVEGMNALGDAYQETTVHLTRAINNVIRNI